MNISSLATLVPGALWQGCCYCALNMSDTVIIFGKLPATFPEKDKYKKPAILSAIVFHAFLIGGLLILPFLLTESIEDDELIATLVSPLGPPPPPPPAPTPIAVGVRPKPAKPLPKPSAESLIMPTVVPKDIARLVDEPNAAAGSGVIGGVPGVPGGVAGGILGSVLPKDAKHEDIPPPAPPPPPPEEPARAVPSNPVRVGGEVLEPRVVKLVPPVYPILASKARVSGVVILEATLTKEGTVDAIKVISGHPLLVNAAIDCLKQWRYEPTYLNGQATAVILTAKVTFTLGPVH